MYWRIIPKWRCGVPARSSSNKSVRFGSRHKFSRFGESSINMTRGGGWRYWERAPKIFRHPKGGLWKSLGELWKFVYFKTNRKGGGGFWKIEPLARGAAKIVSFEFQYLHPPPSPFPPPPPPPLVILNELSLRLRFSFPAEMCYQLICYWQVRIIKIIFCFTTLFLFHPTV